MKPTVFLFDVDGTLVTTGGAGRRAMSRAFEEVWGDGSALDGVRLGGMTDRLILRAGFAKLGHEFDEPSFDALIASYLVHLEDEVPRSEGYRVFSAVEDAIGLCGERGALGLGTGNVRLGAEIKLRHAALDGHFAFGGFGCDAEDRGELLEAGAVRGAARLGVPRDEVRVVVIGDTPKDVSAAHAIGARCIAVATGGYTVEILRDSGADAVFGGLDSPGALDAILDA